MRHHEPGHDALPADARRAVRLAPGPPVRRHPRVVRGRRRSSRSSSASRPASSSTATPELLGLRELRARLAARHDVVGLRRHRARHLAAGRDDAAARTSPRGADSVPVSTNVLPARWPSAGGRSSSASSSRTPAAASSATRLLMVGVAEPRDHRLGDHHADARDGGDLLLRGLLQGGDRAEVARQQLGVDRAHVRDAETEQHGAERPLLGGLDRRDHVGRRPLLEAVQLEQLLDREPVQVARPLDDRRARTAGRRASRRRPRCRARPATRSA